MAKRLETPNMFEKEGLTNVDIEKVLRGDKKPFEDKKVQETQEKKPKKKARKIESKQSKKNKNEYVKIHISITKEELQELDELVDYLVENREIPEKNRSFIIRLALKKYTESVFS